MANKKKKTSKVGFKFDAGTFLLWTGGAANVTMWIGAFSSTEAKGPVGEWINLYFLPILGSLSGLAMGITAVAGLVFVLSRFSGMQPTYERKVRGKDEFKTYTNYRYWMTLSILVLFFVLSFALLAPFAFAQLSGAESLYGVLGDVWARWWSVARIVASDLILGGVALVMGVHPGANRSAGEQTSSESLSGKSGDTANRSAGGSGRSAKPGKRKAVAGAVFACPHTGAGCNVTKGTQEAINAHAGRCKFKPTISMPADVHVEKVEK